MHHFPGANVLNSVEKIPRGILLTGATEGQSRGRGNGLYCVVLVRRFVWEVVACSAVAL